MLRSQDRPFEVAKASAVIASGGSLSAAVDLGGLHAIGIIMPAAWTAAGLTFSVSVDGENFADLYAPDGTEYALVVVAAHHVYLDLGIFAGFNSIKFRSGTGSVPVNQAAERTLTIVSRSL
ncbi:hypothetical protein [Mesorhizobium onobrychidis]|uniref:Uncharacterized protein n=1 Tax=Mesorhizobium onobrychidis TaxID=2775404 RepID=A0ABY5QU61_9HYPH|nr:hypothetical protein [Mesorhizobium onobrychidis]UVC14715.1 hypothetical protein IHQ72_29550 [Mesorhizobium onobrychidis]